MTQIPGAIASPIAMCTSNNGIRPVPEIYSRNVSRDSRREIRNEEMLFPIADAG